MYKTDSEILTRLKKNELSQSFHNTKKYCCSKKTSALLLVVKLSKIKSEHKMTDIILAAHYPNFVP